MSATFSEPDLSDALPATSGDLPDARPFAPWGPVPAPPPGHSWESLMTEALAEADLALAEPCPEACPELPESEIPVPEIPVPEIPVPEIPVGAVVVTADGRIVGRGHNASVGGHDPTAHAEIMALRAAARTLGNYRLGGCVLVVTLEPCLMCVGAMVHARVAGCVFGAADMRAGMVQSCLNGLDLPFHNHTVWHYGGVRAEACAAVLHRFFGNARIRANTANMTNTDEYGEGRVVSDANE